MIIQSRLQKIPRYWTEPIYKFSSWLSDNLKIKQVQDIWQKQLKEGKNLSDSQFAGTVHCGRDMMAGPWRCQSHSISNQRINKKWILVIKSQDPPLMTSFSSRLHLLQVLQPSWYKLGTEFSSIWALWEYFTFKTQRCL